MFRNFVAFVACTTFCLLSNHAFAQLKYANTFIVHPSGQPGGLAVADFDRTGYPDIAVIHGSTLSIYPGEGSGTFGNNIDTQLAANSVSVDMQAADLNGDGNVDVVIAQQTPQQLVVLPGNGNGSFGTPLITPLPDLPYQIALGDFNNDGKVDLAVRECPSSSSECDIAVYLGKGDGTFSPYTVLPAPGAWSYYKDMEVNDFNRDGKLDIAVAEMTGSSSAPTIQLQVYVGTGTGAFNPGTPVRVPYSVPANYGADAPGVISGDFNGDAIPDLGVETGVVCGGSACGNATMNIYLNNGSGSLSRHSAFSSSGDTGAGSWVAADLNNDLKIDLLRYNSEVMGGSMDTWLNGGSGAFSSTSNNDSSTTSYAAVRDMSLNGRHDVVQADWDFGDTDVVVGMSQNGTPNCTPPRSSVLSAKICSPGTKANSATFTVKASGNSPVGLKRLELWVDGVKRAQALNDQLQHGLKLSAGTHKLVVVAVDQYAGIAKTTDYVKVP